MSTEGVSAERKAEREKQGHEAKLQRQMLDCIEVVKPVRGDILVLRVPDELFVHPGTKPEDVSDEQREAMQAAHGVLATLLQNLAMIGIQLGGAAIIGQNMKLEDLPPPWQKHPDAEQASIPVARSRILLPPGTKI